MLHLHDHGQLLGAITRDTIDDGDTSDQDDGSPRAVGGSRRRRGLQSQATQAAGKQPLPRGQLNALESLAAWQECSVLEMAQRLSAMTEAERTQLRTDYAMADEC